MKHDQGKLRWGLVPPSFEKVVEVYGIGAKKYGDHNWRKGGLVFSRYFAAMMRHAWAWWRGEKFDPEDGQHHLASVAWAAISLMQLEDEQPQDDDRWTGSAS